MHEFSRIKRLPPYVFNITNELKMNARRRGDDIIDLSMGNPDGPTPQHIVDKLVEAAQRQDTHGYSVSKGIPRLRRAIATWYQRRYGVELDPDSEAIVTIGSQEGLGPLQFRGPGRGGAGPGCERASSAATRCWGPTRPTRSTSTGPSSPAPTSAPCA